LVLWAKVEVEIESGWSTHVVDEEMLSYDRVFKMRDVCTATGMVNTVPTSLLRAEQVVGRLMMVRINARIISLWLPVK
jgi:hypothetical protein